MENKRQRQVGELVRRELAQILLRHPDEPIYKKISLTHVEMSPDLAYAKIFFSMLLSDSETGTAIKILRKKSPSLRHLLAQGLNLRITPHLTFVYDESIQRAQKLTSLIEQAIARDTNPQ